MNRSKISAEIICDSLNPLGVRITTFELKFNRYILSEINTHRSLIKNCSSSRSEPVSKHIERISNNLTYPDWRVNGKGMSSSEIPSEIEKSVADKVWENAHQNAVQTAMMLSGQLSVNVDGTVALDQGSPDTIRLNMHKQNVNRVLEPFSQVINIMTGTEWNNFFNLRFSEFAQPEFEELAGIMALEYLTHKPVQLEAGQWHLPFVQEDEKSLPLDKQIKLSTARTARASYLSHDGKRDLEKDFELHDRLLSGFHLSPTEHPNEAMDDDNFHGPVKGFKPYRKQIVGENGDVDSWKKRVEEKFGVIHLWLN